jgi:hypothetical protein
MPDNLESYNNAIEALKANSSTTTTTTTVAPVKKNRKPVCNGRPKGLKNYRPLGLSLKKRLKILGEIAMNKNNDPRDVIAACKEISNLLNDRIKETENGVEETVLSFTDAKNPSKKHIENIEKIEKTIQSVTKIEKGNTPILSPVEKTPENSNVSSIELSFSIDSNHKKIDYD